MAKNPQKAKKPKPAASRLFSRTPDFIDAEVPAGVDTKLLIYCGDQSAMYRIHNRGSIPMGVGVGSDLVAATAVGFSLEPGTFVDVTGHKIVLVSQSDTDHSEFRYWLLSQP